MKQQSKVHWLKCGDGNNNFFHASLKTRKKTGIHVLFTEQGTKLTSEADIQNEVLGFYKSLMGTPAVVTTSMDIQIIRNGNLLDQEQRLQLIAPITRQEVKNALMSIGDDKAPGIDGYSSKFFKAAWGIIPVLFRIYSIQAGF